MNVRRKEAYIAFAELLGSNVVVQPTHVVAKTLGWFGSQLDRTLQNRNREFRMRIRRQPQAEVFMRFLNCIKVQRKHNVEIKMWRIGNTVLQNDFDVLQSKISEQVSPVQASKKWISGNWQKIPTCRG
jgi:hypothetical protein